MKEKYILEKGYKEFKPTQIHSDRTSKCFQRRFDDDIGKKYFININKNDWKGLLHKEVEDSYIYEYEVQLYSKDTHDAINMLFHSSWTLDQVEEFVENMFQSGTLDYYEKWDE